MTKPSRRVRELCETLGLGLSPHPDVPESDWEMHYKPGEIIAESEDLAFAERANG